MFVLKIELYNELEGKNPIKLAESTADLPALRAQGDDRKVISFNPKMIPIGKITAEVTFFPKNTRIKRVEAVCVKKRVHRGHRYEPNYFPQITRCAFCHDVLWGFLAKQGLKCQNCSRAVHTHCYDRDLAECVARTNLDVEDRNKAFSARVNHK